jgi:hypothetical protein
MSNTIQRIPASRTFKVTAIPCTDTIGRRVRIQDLRKICQTYVRLPWDFSGQGLSEQAALALEFLGVNLEGATMTEDGSSVLIHTSDFETSWD